MSKNRPARTLPHWLAVDDPAFFCAQREVLARKKFLRQVYEDFYRLIRDHLPFQNNRVVELGSGAGFIERIIPQAIKTDIFFQPFTQAVLDGRRPPFARKSLDAIVFLDVFHHIPEPRVFLRRSAETLRTGGRIIMIEPWVSAWSRLIYSTLHQEPLDWQSPEWEFESSGPITSANQALPWIVFERDRRIFEKEFPDLEMTRLKPLAPFRFLLSGGTSSRLGLPGFCYQTVKGLEKLFEKRIERWAMFALIALEKVR